MRLIDADALMECYNGVEKYHVPVGVVKANIEDMPTIDAVPVRHGQWLYYKMGVWMCSECNNYAPFWRMASTQNLTDYCPNCGARMNGGVDDAAD